MAKVLCLLGVFALMLAGILVPVRLMMQVDYEKAQNYRKALALCNSFGGGVFLATCFNALLPAVRDKVSSYVLKILDFVEEKVDWFIKPPIIMSSQK